MAHSHQHQINDNGICTTCNVTTNPQHILECFICLLKYHGDCNGIAPFTTKSFVSAFNKLKHNDCFVFICPHCRTQRENTEASTLKQQMSEVLAAVATLSKEIAQMKERTGDTKVSDETSNPNDSNNNSTLESNDSSTSYKEPSQNKQSVWNDVTRMKKVKEGVTLCVKSDRGEPINMDKVKEIVANNGVQVMKTSINKKNGDLYIDLPSNEIRDKLVPLLDQADISGNRIINIKQKCPTISLRNVTDFVDEEDFITKVKAQNDVIRDKIESGSEFSVVFTRENKVIEDEQSVLIVLRVGNDIRDSLKSNNDRLFFGTNSYRVMDRFYVKSCAKCHKFGHYHAECTNTPCCGFCHDESHNSENCPIRKTKDHTQYKCVNCKDKNIPHDGHSSHYSKCPTLIEIQKKTMLNIPYYAKNVK